MKIQIGPYKNWFGPYQLADLLRFVGVSKDKSHEIGRWLSNTWLSKFLLWIDKKRARKVNIRIDKYDTWNMNNTLALIIAPMLKQLRETTHGSPLVDDEDVPDELKSTSAPPKKNEYDIDDNHHKRWEWVLQEMEWAFEQYNIEWEHQYYSGEPEWLLVDSGKTYFNPITKKDEKTYEMVTGPNHTFKSDDEKIAIHKKRILNGVRLFSKYYDGLWD